MTQNLLYTLVELALGLLFCFAGYKLFRLLMPILGFVLGYFLGTTGAHYTGLGFISSIPLWVVGIVVGLVFALLVYIFYYVAFVLLCLLFGYLLGFGIATASLPGQGTAAIIVGIAAAVILAALTIALNLPKALIIILTALEGASSIVASALVLLKIIPNSNFHYGPAGIFLKGSWIWGIAWLLIALLGIITQYRNSQQYSPLQVTRGAH